MSSHCGIASGLNLIPNNKRIFHLANDRFQSFSVLWGPRKTCFAKIMVLLNQMVAPLSMQKFEVIRGAPLRSRQPSSSISLWR